MREEIYQGCKIRSTPYKLAQGQDGKYSVNGVIQIDRGNETIDIMTQNLNVPDNEWTHETEASADAVFIKYAKFFIDANFHVQGRPEK